MIPNAVSVKSPTQYIHEVNPKNLNGKALYICSEYLNNAQQIAVINVSLHLDLTIKNGG